jgi:hypothetical protein
VPQGAIPAPTLYNIFTSDVPTTVECKLATFADDTAIFVSDIDPAEVCSRLQRQLDTLSDYFKNLKIRVKDPSTKTQAIYFTRRTSSRMLPASGIKFDDQEKPWSPEVKYLGLYLDKRLTFASHNAESIKRLKWHLELLTRFSIK